MSTSVIIINHDIDIALIHAVCRAYPRKMTDDAEAQEDEMMALRSILIDDDDDGGQEGTEDAAVILERVEDSGLWHGRISVAAEMVR